MRNLVEKSLDVRVEDDAETLVMEFLDSPQRVMAGFAGPEPIGVFVKQRFIQWTQKLA
jgi:hypothetical protein